MSGGRHDASVLSVGHSDGGRFVADVVRARLAPHDPTVVVGEFAALLKSYGLRVVTGDNFSAEWPVQAFRAYGVEYRRAELAKSAIHLECLFPLHQPRAPEKHASPSPIRS
jgi:hypothetical protein